MEKKELVRIHRKGFTEDERSWLDLITKILTSRKKKGQFLRLKNIVFSTFCFQHCSCLSSTPTRTICCPRAVELTIVASKIKFVF